MEQDEKLAELLPIRTQTEFANKYGVENSTLTNWNKLIVKEDVLSEMQKWAQQLTKNVLFALYTNIMENANASNVKLWLQVVHGWDPKQRIEPNYQGVTEITISTVQ